MRTISRTNRFKKDYKREAKGQHREALDALLTDAVSLLLTDSPLPERQHDHALSREWKDHTTATLGLTSS
jgi:mRNA interferase YafQ